MSQMEQPGVQRPEGQRTQQRGGMQQSGMQQGQTQQGMQGGGRVQGGQTMRSRFFPTQNYLPQQVRTASVQMLNRVLVDASVVLTHVRSAHWNVKGPNFFGLHELFEEIYEDLAEHVDEIAERVTALGGEAKGTTRVAASNARIPGLPEGPVTGQEYVQAVAERLSILDGHLGEGIRFATQQDDPDTADLLNDVSREVTKNLWFLEAHLQTQPIPEASGQQRGQQFGGQPTGQGQGFGGGFQQSGGEFQQPGSQGQQYGGSQQPTGQGLHGQQFGGQPTGQGIGGGFQQSPGQQFGQQPTGQGQQHGGFQQPTGQQPTGQGFGQGQQQG